MRYRIFIVALLLQTQVSFGQTVKDIFLELPLGGLSLAQKEQMVYNFLNQKGGTEKERPYLIDYQPENYFLSFSGAYEGSEVLKCWKVSNGSQLIGVTYRECEGPCDDDLSFYIKSSNKVSKVPYSYVVPEVTIADFFDIEGMKKDGVKPINKEAFTRFFGFLYHLPQNGENIRVESQTHRFGKIPEEYKKYDLGANFELVWNDGTFIKQKNTMLFKEAGTGNKEKQFTIENCVTEFSMEAATETKVGYQFWFVDREFLDGRTLKMSVVAPHSQTHDPHKHPEDEMFYVLEGTAEFYLNGKTKVAGPNTSFYCPPNIEHGIKNVGDTELKYLVIKKYEE
ncbi:cupin domain-containing protein [Fulvivirga sp.]|uniref:cupin domain-containing protein n=1 Tax=Fulvivirga sp. TaxID=1931237 RepID=UPI0032EA9E15